MNVDPKKIVAWVGIPGACLAAVLAFGSQWDGWQESQVLLAQEAARAVAHEVVEAEQAAVIEQLQGLNDNVRVLIDQDAMATCREIGPTQISYPDNWGDLDDRQRYAVCQRESRYRHALWDYEDDCEEPCDDPPLPEEVP